MKMKITLSKLDCMKRMNKSKVYCKNKKKFEQMIQSLIDSGQFNPVVKYEQIPDT